MTPLMGSSWKSISGNKLLFWHVFMIKDLHNQDKHLGVIQKVRVRIRG